MCQVSFSGLLSEALPQSAGRLQGGTINIRHAVFSVKTATVLRDSRERFREIVAHEHMDPERLQALQDQRAIAHARFAMEHSPYYRDRYSAAGFTLKDLEDPAAFASLPIIEKSEVREHSDRFASSEANPKTARPAGTGGSTSAPLKLLHDRRVPVRALEWRLYRWWGVHPSDNIATIYRQFWSEKESQRHSLRWWPSRRFQLDTSRLDRSSVDAFISDWRRWNPSLLTGYVGGIVELARMLEDRGISLSPPVAVAVTAAPMSPAQRTEIEAVFRAPVYDHYRCGEFPWIAGECSQHDGMHTFADLRKVEVVGTDDRQVAAGVTGETVITDLTNRVFPLIRYRLGDRTSPIDGVCRCGVTLPRISSVAGRVTESARLPNGQVIAGDFLTEIFVKNPEAVRQFQVHQQADYSIVLRCILGSSPRAEEEVDSVVRELRDVVGDAVPVRLELVETIPHDGGKIRYIKSDVIV
ncbi:phenylacetate--CoA ligase family protein [Mycetocola manganoxydans]|uniref:phenylacetate--CoA ligase family protein n=1 Tax=Mycetocola manganoxydans TaxID=699879 RepID=UPI0011C448E3|nr:phenylacetate--CoA ligase family protein [Mycetocola manganoxydans]GHD38533.1 capsular polysaccharide biosynthesis protein CapK [Mycetocola manganoxydans]